MADRIKQVGMSSNPTSGGLIQNYQIGNFNRDYSSLHTRSARNLIIQTDYGLYRKKKNQCELCLFDLFNYISNICNYNEEKVRKIEYD